MPVPFLRLPSGTVLVDAPSAVAAWVVVYARVSCHDQRAGRRVVVADPGGDH